MKIKGLNLLGIGLLIVVFDLIMFRFVGLETKTKMILFIFLFGGGWVFVIFGVGQAIDLFIKNERKKEH